MMKKSLTLKIFTIIASFLFAGSVISHKTNIKTNATEIVESTFLDVNKYNNNSYDESSKLYITMLHFDKAFASEDKSTINIANSSEELGNKMTLNGIAVKDVSNFFAAYYDAGSSGSMILLKMSEANLFPSNNYNVTTIKLPKGTHIYDAYVKDDVTIRLLNNEWAPSFGSDVSFLPNGIEGITAYGLRTGYELVSPSSLNYQEGTGSVLKIKETSPDLGASGATLDFSYRGIDVSSISEITFKVRFDFNGDISGSELRLSNNGTSSFLLRYYISNCVSGNWYSITLKSNQTAISDIPNGSAVETPRSMAKFGITLGQFEVGVRVKGTSITTYLADVQIDYVQKTSSSFIRVNSFNNNVYNKDDKVYSTMLEFDTPFASENKSHINIATKDYDLGNKMTLNGVAVKDIPGFYAAYYDAGKDGYMIWFVIPEEYIKPSNGYDYTTILIPMYTNIYDVKVAKDVNLTLVNGSWVSSLKQSTFLKVNQYNNNVAEGSLYRTMLQFDMPFYNQNMSGINIAVEENDLGEKMTLNGVAVKNIKDFFASYYDAGKDGQMIIVKIPESALVPSNDYHLPTLFMPKGTLIYDAVTKNDVSLVLNHGSWYEADEKWHTQPDPIDEYDYSFAIVGDTQIVNDLKPDLYPYIYDWVVDNAENKKIQHVIGLGDITNRNLEEEWGRARDSFDKLEEIGLTHTQVRGNHDQPKEYEEFFQADDFYKDGILGYYKTIANSYRIVSVGEINYLMLTLDYGPDDDVLKWADGICEKYDDYNVIVVTHGYLYKDGTTLDVHDSIPPSLTGGVNNGDQIWDKFVKKHENITMVLSGHIECDNIVISQAVGDNGNIVTQVLIDPQGLDKIAPSGMVAMFYFSNGGQTIQVEYYSPISGLYETTSATKKFTVPVIETKPHIHEWEDEWTIDFNPTCTESGSKSHHCKGCEEVKDVTTISPIGHIAGEPVKENVVEATHNKAGSYDLVTYCTGCYMEMSRETITVSPIPHDYDDITYTWSNDYSSCTATATCECGDIVNETVSATISTIEASCTEEGTKTYTATFDNDIFETQTYSENIEKVDHSYGDAVYTWSTNHQICTATLVCSECGKEISESVFVNVSVNSPTCSEDGIKTYTATFDNPLFEEQQFSEIIPATGHNYQNPTYTWDLDSMTCTATATCECGDEMSETVQISVLDDRYEADFSNSFFSKQTKDREKEPVNKSTGCGGSIESMSFIIPLFAMGLAFRFYRKRFKN